MWVNYESYGKVKCINIRYLSIFISFVWFFFIGVYEIFVLDLFIGKKIKLLFIMKRIENINSKKYDGIYLG